MKTNEFAHFEREIINFTKNVNESLKGLFRLFVLVAKLIQSLVKAPVLRKQIAPDNFEEVERWSWNIQRFPGPPQE